MRAFQMTAWRTEPTLREVEDPVPGHDEVIVRIAGAGVCHSDLHLLHDFDEGLTPWSLPFTLGHENAGWIESLGDGVEGFSIGDPVAVYGAWGCGHCNNCDVGKENYCLRSAHLRAGGGGFGADGGQARLMRVPHARRLVPLGDLDPVVAAPLTDAGLTPYHAIKRSLALLVPGSTAVVIGAGGLGNMAVQILRATSPATVVAVDERPAALERSSASGALAVALPSEAQAAVSDHTGGRGADLVLDFVGADATMALGASLGRTLGQLTVVGIAGGALPVGFFTVPFELSVATTYWGTIPELREVIALAQSGRILPATEVYPLERAADAYRALSQGTLVGRAVIVPG
ncbi:NAD(P)-dependent alcohol dehydrogenase [Acidiferrimicrobium sp. IK]|uniref:NAD(P)-dependent alcohol dehydrogenase n=1 Tax=Acidiferrimicrobium sp. IK TaxID=2871700 RepID=UPI0021CB805D|nr:NAD(P)-dependent alcohol dehydrogenase [Acidiferrimicrobium sp. IK]MCU4187402.1 NAD(P)-dependent alcohol dehydrogenase [Acidiferrimicrobium sp. IK]